MLNYIKETLAPALLELFVGLLIIILYVTAGLLTSLAITNVVLHDVVIVISLFAAFYTLALLAKKQTGDINE